MIKKKIGGILAASALICATTTALPANAQDLDAENTSLQSIEGRSQTSVGVVINCPEGLNLRKGPSTKTSILRLLPNGTKVEILSSSNNWTRVKYNGIYGYVYSKYVKVNNASKETTMSATGKVSNTGGSGLNLRSKASTNSSVVMTIKEGKSVTVLAKSGAWYKVKYSNKTGYVHSNYIKLVSSNNNSNSSTNNTGNGDVVFSSNGYVGNTDNLGLFMRTSPSTKSAAILTIPQGATLKIVAKNGEWYKVSYAGKTGYAHSDYIVLGNKPTATPPATPPTTNTGNGDVAFSSNGYVGDTDNLGLFMRTSPSTNSTVVLTIPQGATLNIVAKNGEWYKVSYGGKTGYAHSDYIVLGDKPVNSKATFDEVYNVMKAHIGTPYVWGGSGEYITDSSIANLKSRFPYEAADGWYNYIGREYYNKGYRAFDCSGLMQWGFAQVGISIGRTTYTQVNAGVGVSISNAQPGDLLITKDQGHVGMYIGNGQWIESPAPGYSIRISTVNWNNIGYARRVL